MNNTVHFVTHFRYTLTQVKQVQSGQGDPAQLVVLLDNVGPHTHEHLEHLKGDPTAKSQYKTFVKMQMMLGKMADQFKKQVAKLAKSKSQEKPSVDPQMMEGIMKVMGDLKLKEMKLQGDETRKERKLEADLRRKDLTSAANINRRMFESQINGAR
jgi:hypothetical protein